MTAAVSIALTELIVPLSLTVGLASLAIGVIGSLLVSGVIMACASKEPSSKIESQNIQESEFNKGQEIHVN